LLLSRPSPLRLLLLLLLLLNPPRWYPPPPPPPPLPPRCPPARSAEYGALLLRCACRGEDSPVLTRQGRGDEPAEAE
jgi:hypothetical protein